MYKEAKRLAKVPEDTTLKLGVMVEQEAFIDALNEKSGETMKICASEIDFLAWGRMI